ncbi:acyl-CoA thioesterase [Variovorax sp. LT1R20]|uniref:acyl-CoA thioesterase n=1 Tax=Variovorax sp. LT1R20 TaxID=3443729 RepID=UPI003F4896E5
MSDAAHSPQRTVPPRRDELRFWTQEKLRNADTDQFRHVNNAIISTLLEAARMEIFAPAAVRPLMDGANLAVVRLLIEFRHEVYFPGRVDIGSTVLAVGNTSLRVRQGLFMDGSDTCLASAEATCVLLHPGLRRSHPVGAELRRYLLANAHGGGDS